MPAVAINTGQPTQFKTEGGVAIGSLQLSKYSQNVLIDGKNVLIKGLQVQAPAGSVLGSNGLANTAPIQFEFSIETVQNVLADGQPVLVVNDKTPVVTGTFQNSGTPSTISLPVTLTIADAGQTNVEAT